ncbi:PTS sugar transporter subunit IIA [Lactobacillus sp. ESL0791]|uniref:PTS sugar transporter subunit IIA n=1 Tax=Lactobacillus sp. ESL0791 TaxID=2983234 RepID=UPI0023F7F4F5|nr:PTS sugar transporter subunit IIA [Lactobacillus sp. ESL0791]MDF7639249.1 PTS sugar transporter subunit IIA [Lactobacillus sp. ESL0791]
MIFDEQNVQVVDSIANWQEAVKLASEPLIANQSISEKYITNMIKSVGDNGPYMVLADYFALMHARPGEGVNKMSMSLLVTHEAVDLAGKPVKIFLIMAATDNASHLESLQKVMTIFMDQDDFQTILTGKKDKIISILNKMED